MKRKIFLTALIVSLIVALPAFSANAAVSPEDMANLTRKNPNGVSTNDVYDYDGNTVEIIEQTEQSAIILLNDTYQLDLSYNDSRVGVKAQKLDSGGVTPQADELLFDAAFSASGDGQLLEVLLPDMFISIGSSGPNSDQWNATIIGETDPIEISFNSTSRDLVLFDGMNEIEIKDDFVALNMNDGSPANDLLLYRFNDTLWEITSPSGLIIVNYNPSANYLHIDYAGPLYNGGIPPSPQLPFILGPPITISFYDNGVLVEWAGASVYIHAFMVVIIFDYITITWYFGLFIERIVILIWELTLVFYITIAELLIVIIYETFEIKIYETQVVIVYEFIEIIILFVSLVIWELTFIFHFEFWFIQLIFLVQVNFFIVLPVRVIFVPIIVPVFIPMVYYVPVYINNYVNIYVPYASPALYIDVYDQILETPNHTIEYLVTDQAGLPVVDATVTVNYDGLDYVATHLSGGIYQVELPASNETETIQVTATKNWYPDGFLSYDLLVDWVIGTDIQTETTTVQGSLGIIAVIMSITAVAATAIFLRKKKKVVQ